MDDLISKYIDRASFSADTDFAKSQLNELLAAYNKVKESMSTLKGATGTANIVSGAQEATVAVKGMTAALTAQNQVIGQSAQIYSAQNNSLQQNIKNLNDYKKALSDNAVFQKQAVTDVQNGKISADEYREKITDLTTAQFKYKQAISDTTKEIKNQTLLNSAAPTSILEAQTQNKQLTTQRNALPTTDTAGLKQYNDLIDRNNQLIDANSDKLAKQKINVGNYGPSVKAALSVLEEELMKINAQLAVTDKNSSAFGVLSNQANLLKSVSTGLDKTFTSTRTELRALEEAAKQVGSEFGISSEQFQKFAAEIGSRKKDLDEVQKAINFQANPIKNLDAIVKGVQAITGAYGAYQAAVALTGDDNEELQKSMVKLQAVLTLVTSVQAVANSLQTDGAAIQGLLALKANVLAAAQKIVAIASGETTTALAAQTVAAETAVVSTTELAAAQTAAAVGGEAIAAASVEGAVGMEAEAVGAGTLAGTLDAVVVSEGAVATGAITMATAIAATGIGLIIIGLAIAVYKIVEAVKDWNAADASVKKANEDLTKSLKDLLDATKAFDDANRLSTQRQLQDMDNLIAKRKAMGVTSAESLALDKQSIDLRLKYAQEELTQNDITLKSVKDREAAMQNDAANVKAVEELKQKYINQTAKKKAANDKAQAGGLLGRTEDFLTGGTKLDDIGDKDYDKSIKRYDDLIKKNKEVADLSASLYKDDSDKFNATENLKQQSVIITDQTIVLSDNDRRKLIQESAKIEVDIETAKNDKILNSEYSTLDERLAALKDNLAQQKKAINADNQAVQSDPTVSGADKTISTKNANASIFKAETESQIAIIKLKEDYRLKDLAATTEIQKSIYNVISQTNTDIANNDALTESQRLTALKKSIEARKAVLDTQFNTDLSSAGITDPDIERIKQEGFFEISNKKITNEELKKLIADYNTSVVALSKDSATERINIEKSYYQQYVDESEKALKKIQQENDVDANKAEDIYNKDIVALNSSYVQGLISAEQYNKERLKLDNDYAKQSLQIQIDSLEKVLDVARSSAEEEKRLQKELSDLKNQDTSKMSDDELLNYAQKKQLTEDELKAVGDAVGKESDLYKQLSALKAKLSDQDKKNLDDYAEDVIKHLNKIKDYGDQVGDVLSGVVNAFVTAQKNALQTQSDALDKNSAREIELINASADAEQVKANKIAIITARTQSQKDLIAQKQKQADRAQALADKAKAIFDIILNTAIGIAKALTHPIEIPFIAAIGAAELAIAIATPIPKFKHGKNNDYEGPAIVGDGGKSEVIKRADGSIEITPAHDTLTHLNKDDIVFPDLMDFMIKNAMPKMKTIPIDHNMEREMINILGKKMDNIAKEIKNKKALQLGATDKGMVAIWKHGANSTKYINENTNW